MDRKRRIQLYPQNESKYQEYLKQAEENVVYKVPGINRIRNTIVVNMTIQKSLVDFLTIQGIDDYLLNCLKATMSTYVWKAGKEMCEDMQAKIAKSKKMRYLPAMADLLIQIGNGYWLAEDMDEYVKNENRTSKKGSFTVLCTLEQGRYVF